mmetsp:Transcript_54048/g.126246  ORF Transcript_54048/g.126246 Transcript_54048/m.126246 type:complete len:220 (+) Transcript_54048:947-1606(+)
MLPSTRSISRSTWLTPESHQPYNHLCHQGACFFALRESSGMQREDLFTMCFLPSSQLKLCLRPTHWLKPYEQPVVSRNPSLVNFVVTHQCIPTRCAQLLSHACVAKFMMMQSSGGFVSPKEAGTDTKPCRVDIVTLRAPCVAAAYPKSNAVSPVPTIKTLRPSKMLGSLYSELCKIPPLKHSSFLKEGMRGMLCRPEHTATASYLSLLLGLPATCSSTQ